MKTNAHHYTLRHVKRKALIDTMCVALEEAKLKHLQAHWDMWRPRQTLGDSLSDVEALAQADTKAVTLKEAKAYALLPDTTRFKGRGTALHIA